MEKSTYLSKPRAVVVCSYCSRLLAQKTVNNDTMSNQAEPNPPQVSHGICPDCLLANHPQEYLLIQSEQRLRIKHAYDNDLPSFKNKYL